MDLTPLQQRRTRLLLRRPFNGRLVRSMERLAMLLESTTKANCRGFRAAHTGHRAFLYVTEPLFDLNDMRIRRQRMEADFG